MSLVAVRARAVAMKVRHVRTPAGQRRFGQPIGSVIVRDQKLPNLKVVESEWDDWAKVEGSDGNNYYVGRDGSDWVATTENDWNAVVKAGSEDDLYEALNAHVGGGKKPAAKKPARERAKDTAKKPAAKKKVDTPLKPGDPYKKVGKGIDLRGEDPISIPTSDIIPMDPKAPWGKNYKRTNIPVIIKPGSKSEEKLRKQYGIPPAYSPIAFNVGRKEGVDDADYDGLAYEAFDPNKKKWQPVYSTRHHHRQSNVKFGGSDEGDLSKVPELIENRDALMAQFLKDTKSRDPKTRAAAAGMLVMAKTGIRIGTPHKKGERAIDRRYGAHSLEAKHVRVNKDSVTFTFMAKGSHQRFNEDGSPMLNSNGKNIWPGKKYVINVKDPDLVTVMRSATRGKSHSDRLFEVNPGQMSAYFKAVQEGQGLSGNMTPHNFRAAKATLSAVAILKRMKPPKNEQEFKKARRQVATEAGAIINDSPDVAFHSYIMPSVWGPWMKDHPEWKDVKF